MNFETLPPIPGEDPAFLDVIEHVSALAMVSKPCLVVGERGTGKELFTTRLHYLSPRWDHALIKVNCAALTESLLDSELFGHEAGAFTGAVRRHVGCFERADGGTLVLDEIASASLAVQEKILRVIEYGELQRVGGKGTLEVDVRIVAASNVDLPSLARRNAFRPDLLDRLAFDVITLPPLRARPADILPLALGFGLEITQELGREVFSGFSARAEAALAQYRWPGNVRELKNVVERSLYRAAPGEPVNELVFDPFDSPWRPPSALALTPAAALPAAVSDSGPTVAPPQPQATSGGDSRVADQPSPDHGPGPGEEFEGFTEAVRRFEKKQLTAALTAWSFNQTRAAKQLGLSYHQLRRLLKKHALA